MKRYRFLSIALIATLTLLITSIPVLASSGGLTPGYWKQEKHFDDWVPTPYSPGDKLNDVLSAFVLAAHNDHGEPYYGPIVTGMGPNFTLLDALKQGGGGEKAMLRHMVAALLNCTHPDIQMVSEEVLARWINYAYHPSSHSPPYSFEDVKDHMEGWNTFDPNFEL